MHWGEEYRMAPDSYQTGLAAFLAENNVDLIIGHHPHVLQRFERLPRADGKETLCFYSLGNFVAHQKEKERILGAFMLVIFVKESSASGEYNLYIANSGLIPTVCHFDAGFSNTKVYPLYLYSEELLEKHFVHTVDKLATMDFFHSVLNGLGAEIIMQNPFGRD
jgi:poly-gamma-glutamate synthesis protein (capsule biosynthesis protein)